LEPNPPPTSGAIAHAIFRNAKHPGQQGSQAMRLLCGIPDDQFVIRRLIRRNDAWRLHRHRRQPLIDETLFHDDVGVLERLFRVPCFKGEPEPDVSLGPSVTVCESDGSAAVENGTWARANRF
jgi:hypothetical protein